MLHSWQQLRGHAEQRELFRRSIARGRLSHAYAFHGPDGIGKRSFARLLAKSLYCERFADDDVDFCDACNSCRSMQAGTWPDYHEVGIPKGKREIPISVIAGDDDKRGRDGLCYEMSRAALPGSRKIAVISDADAMNPESANALLKTLEEPPSRALLLLTCEDPATLLTTIRSRCQMMRFFPLPDADVVDLLVEHELAESATAAADVADLADGSLSAASRLLQPEFQLLRKAVSGALNSASKMSWTTVAKELKTHMDEIGTDAPTQRESGQVVLKFAAETLRRRARALAGGDLSEPLMKHPGARRGIDLLTTLVRRTSDASHQIDQNVQVSLVLEAYLDEVGREFRRATSGR